MQDFYKNMIRITISLNRKIHNYIMHQTPHFLKRQLSTGNLAVTASPFMNSWLKSGSEKLSEIK